MDLMVDRTTRGRGTASGDVTGDGLADRRSRSPQLGAHRVLDRFVGEREPGFPQSFGHRPL